MSTDDRTETITDRAAIRDSDEPSERGDFPYYDLGPATSETVGALDLDAIEMNAWKYGTRPPAHTVAALVSEVRQLRFREQSSADAAHANYVAAEAAEDALARVTREAEALRAKVAALQVAVSHSAESCADGPCEFHETEFRAESAEAKVAAVEALAERLAASLALVLYDAHPVYGSTALWHGGIGGQAITAHCAIIHGGPPGMEWTESDLPSMALREFIAASPGFDLDAAKADMLTDLRAALATGEGK